MPTSAAAIDEDRPHQDRSNAGFTLLELTLVLLILSAVLALTVPKLRDPGRAELQSEAHHLQMVFKLLRSEAALSGCAYRLTFDLDQQRYAVNLNEPSCMELADFASDMGSLARGKRLTESVTITDVVLPTLAGKVAAGQIYTVFYPDGRIDETVIHLATTKESYTLWLSPMSGRLKVEPGYHEVEYNL